MIEMCDTSSHGNYSHVEGWNTSFIFYQRKKKKKKKSTPSFSERISRSKHSTHSHFSLSLALPLQFFLIWIPFRETHFPNHKFDGLLPIPLNPWIGASRNLRPAPGLFRWSPTTAAAGASRGCLETPTRIWISSPATAGHSPSCPPRSPKVPVLVFRAWVDRIAPGKIGFNCFNAEDRLVNSQWNLRFGQGYGVVLVLNNSVRNDAVLPLPPWNRWTHEQVEFINVFFLSGSLFCDFLHLNCHGFRWSFVSNVCIWILVRYLFSFLFLHTNFDFLIPVPLKLGRLSVGSAKLARSGMDDLLSSVEGGKHDYDW